MVTLRSAADEFGQLTDAFELAPELLQYDPRIVALPGVGANPLTGLNHPLSGDATVRAGKYFFPGTDGFVDLGAVSLAAAGELSFVLVSKLDSLVASYPMVFGMATTEGAWFEAFYSNTAGYNDFSVGTSSNGSSASSLTQFGSVIGTEHRIVYTQNTLSDSFLWVNGVQVSRGVYNGVSGGTGNTVLGQQGSTALTYDFSGEISVFLLFQKKIPDGLAQALSENPMSAFRGIVRSVSAAAAGGGSTGTVAYTNVNDTSAASGTTTVTGSLAKTNANDTSAASGSTTVVGSLAKTNSNDTVAASGSTTVTGSISKTNANDTCAASGSVGDVSGSLAKTNNNDTSAASGTTTVTGSIAKTNANDTVAASGVVGSVAGSVGYTNVGDSIYALGSSGLAGIGYAGGYGIYRSQKDREEEVRKQRIALGIIQDEQELESVDIVSEEVESVQAEVSPRPSAININALAENRASLVPSQSEINAELKMLLDLELEREEAAIIKLLMEM